MTRNLALRARLFSPISSLLGGERLLGKYGNDSLFLFLPERVFDDPVFKTMK